MVKKTFFYFLIFVSSLALLSTLLSLIHDVSFWFIKVLDFPRLQILILSTICFVLILLIKIKWNALRKITVIGLLAVIIIQASFIIPYTPIVDVTVEEVISPPSGATITILIANVWMKNDRVPDFLEIVFAEDPDMLLVTEVNQWWLDHIDTLDGIYPNKMEYPLDNTYGMALYSKLPLKKSEILFLNHDDVPSFHVQVQLANLTEFNFHGVHPVPPKPSEYPDNVGEKEVELIKVAQMVAEENGPSVVAGDFNDVAWANTSRLFESEGKLYDVRVGRGMYNSFDAKSWIMRWPLDHVYVTKEFGLVELKRLPKFGSDHFSLLVELSL